MSNIAITGGTGLLATNWAWIKKDTDNVCLFTHKNKSLMSGVRAICVDLGNKESILKSFDQIQPDIVIHTAGLTNVDQCELNPEKAEYLNTWLSANVAQACSDRKIKLVHISTDHLFSGDSQYYSESQAPKPLNVYARTKLAAESEVLSICHDSLVVRTNFFGWGHYKRLSISDWVIKSLRKNEIIHAFTDVWFTPILIDRVVEAVDALLDFGFFGIVNICGDARLSKYDFAVRLAREFNLDTQLIRPDIMKNYDFKAVRPEDMSLDNAFVCKILGRNIGDIQAGFAGLYNQSMNGRESTLLQAVV